MLLLTTLRSLSHPQDLLFQQCNTRVEQCPLRAQEVFQLSRIRGSITTFKNKEDFHGPRKGEWMEVGGVEQSRVG